MLPKVIELLRKFIIIIIKSILNLQFTRFIFFNVNAQHINTYN